MQRTSLLILLLTSVSVGAQVMTVDPPVLTPSPVVVPGGPVMGSAVNPAVTNSGPANLTPADLTAMLANLQGAVQEALPVVAAFNDTFVFTNGVAPGANMSVNLGRNMATNVASNFGVNFARPAVAPLGVLNSVAGPPGSVNATMRALVILQQEMQEILPMLNALNGGTNNAVVGAPVPAPGSVTNLFR